MKQTIICSVPMKESIDKVVYSSSDRSIPASPNAFYYPVNSFLSMTITEADDLTVILLVKESSYSNCKQNAEFFMAELRSICSQAGAKVAYKTINTEFSQTKPVYQELMKAIVSELEQDSKIVADITFGSKDVPIVVFTALEFAERHLRCEIDHILYGQADFVNGKAVNTKLCDMIPLYYLNSVTQTIKCDEPEKARQMLQALLSL